MAQSFYETVTVAVNDLVENGFDSMERVNYWAAALRVAAERDLVPEHRLIETLQRVLAGSYTRYVEQNGLLVQHKGIERFTIEKLRPQLRSELNRRVVASAQLIKLNREEAIEKTMRRFRGWATSVPAGGTDVPMKREVKANVTKALKQLPFEERRVLIDQGHKLVASISETIAENSGALAGTWHSNWRQPGYNFRKDHKERDQRVWVVRGNWALERGLMRKGANGYTDEITGAAEEVSCRCHYSWIYNLRDLPDDLITDKGREELARVRAKVRSLA